MRETHYLDTDEEIITAVGRLRHSSQVDNVFVFPKRALILQSIVNLRLLEREAKKLGKRILVMTQDESGRKLAEKAGLMIETYQERQPQEMQKMAPTPLGPTAPPTPSRTHTPPVQKPTPALGPPKRTLGSEEFYAEPPRSAFVKPSLAPTPTTISPPLQVVPPQSLRVRQTDSLPQTSLNSLRHDVRPRSAVPVSPLPSARRSLDPPPVVVQQQAPLSHDSGQSSRRLRRFMGEHAQEQRSAPAPQPQAPPRATFLPPPPPLSVIGTPPNNSPRRFHWVFNSMLVILILGSLSGLSWYVFFPSAVVTLEPQSVEQVLRLDMGSENAETIIPTRVYSLERSLSVTETATGTASGTDKAQGIVKIYNDFSQESQSLVATTRFETRDGKIFRLLKGVVVPGVTEKNGQRERGMVEALIVADAPGSAYNIPPSQFTIPGFKGSPKYDKFSAVSEQPFTGGGSTETPVGKKIVSAEDEARARAKLESELRTTSLDEAHKQLAPGEVVLEDTLTLTAVSTVATPPLGSQTDTFLFESRYTVKMFIINETAVRERIQRERLTSDDVSLSPARFDVRYSNLLPRFDNSQLHMTVESTVVFQAPLDIDSIKKALMGLDESGIRVFLESHPEIKRLQVAFHPQLLITTLPSDPDRLTIEVTELSSTMH